MVQVKHHAWGSVSYGATSRDQVMIVRGAAGVGKSTAMKPISEVAAHRHAAGYEVVGLAPTGSAANKLARDPPLT